MKQAGLVIFLLCIGVFLQSCQETSKKNRNILKVYYEKYPNIYDPLTQEDQAPTSPFQRYETGDYTKAIQELMAIPEGDRARPYALFYTGLAYLEKKKYNEAAEYLQAAIDARNNLTYAPAIYYSALTHLYLNQNEQAVEQLKLLTRNHDYFYPKGRELMKVLGSEQM